MAQLTPAERIFERLQAGLKSVVYPTSEANVETVETISEDLDADPDRVRSHTRQPGIAETVHDLAEKQAA